MLTSPALAALLLAAPAAALSQETAPEDPPDFEPQDFVSEVPS